MRRTLALTTALLAPAALLLASSPAQAAGNDAMVSVLHGVPGATVDVYVNDKLTLDNFTPGTLAGPLALPAGTYSVKITDPADEAKVIIGPASIPVAAGKNYTIAAFLGTDGKPTAKAFMNDTAALKAGEGRVTVRHLANAPAVKVTADSATLVPSLTNGSEATAVVPAKSYKVGVAPAAGGAAVFSTDLPVKEGALTVVYAYGDLAGGSFAAKVQTVTAAGMHSAPSGVPAGEAGLARDGGTGMPGWALALMLAAGITVAGSAGRLVRHRNQG